MLEVEAYDGDYANPRKLRYEFTTQPRNLPASSSQNHHTIENYFRMNPDTGVLSLRKDIEVYQKSVITGNKKKELLLSEIIVLDI